MSDVRLRRGDQVHGWVVDEVLEVDSVGRFHVHREDDATVEAVLQVAPRDARPGIRLRREAFALRGVDHPSAPRLLDKGELAGGHLTWIATRWFEGETLADLVIDTRLRWQDVASIFHQTADALLHLHNQGMVHRDVTPAKIMVNAQLKVCLVGFELAMTDAELERTGRPPLGELAYVAPEVIADRNHHAARADLYSLGVVLHEVLTGKSAFPAALWGERGDPEARMIAWKSRTDALDPGPDVPRWLRSLVKKATDPDPAKRLPDLDAFVGWLEAAREQWATPAVIERVAVPVAPLRSPPMPLVAAPQLAVPGAALGGYSSSLGRPPGVPEPANQQVPMAVAYVMVGGLGAAVGMAVGVFVLLFLSNVPVA